MGATRNGYVVGAMIFLGSNPCLGKVLKWPSADVSAAATELHRPSGGWCSQVVAVDRSSGNIVVND
jgi:hypothetical protein